MRAGLLVAAAAALALSAPAGAAARDASPIRQERWAEDWSGSSVPLKDMRLGPALRLSLGAEARVKVEGLDAPRLGISGERRDAWITQHALAHADLRYGAHVRLFAQVGVHDAVSREIKSSADDDRWDLTQGFVDLSGDFGPVAATLRVGRQEMHLGSPRFVTLRETSNVRQRHDVARLMLESGPWHADLFGGRPTQDRPGAFDDRGDPGQEFYGLRLQRRFGAITADFIDYDLIRRDVHIAGDAGRDRRNSVGAHVAGPAGDYDFDVELLIQSGRFGAQRISAFGGAIDVGRTFGEAPWSPRVAARLTYGSGDHDPSDTRQQTFAPPFPRGAWFGQNGLSSFSNTVEAATTLTLEPRAAVTVLLKLGASWRADVRDFAYAGAASALPGTRGGGAYVGAAPSVAFIWRATPHVAFAGYASAVAVGRDLHDRGAHNIGYANTSVTLSY